MDEFEQYRKAPVIILVEPQMGENIGAAARAMWNFGLKTMRIVNPRDGWPSAEAVAMASGATPVLDNVQVYQTLEEAVADLNYVFATTARTRDMVKPVFAPAEAAVEIVGRSNANQRVGVLFGRERAGLTNDEVALSNAVLTFPTNPQFASLNIAQAVLLVGYAWFIEKGNLPEAVKSRAEQKIKPASREAVIGLFEHLESELDASGFLRPPEKRPNMVRSLRNIFHRAELNDQDVRTLRGVVSSLVRQHERNKK